MADIISLVIKNSNKWKSLGWSSVEDEDVVKFNSTKLIHLVMYNDSYDAIKLLL